MAWQRTPHNRTADHRPHATGTSNIHKRQTGHVRQTCTSNLPGTVPICHTQKVMLLHFSKASGSAVCRLAQAAGCSTWARGSSNCGSRERQYGDGPWWIPVSHAQTEWERLNFAYPDAIRRMRSGRYSCSQRLAKAPQFHAVESTLPGGAPCPGFFTLALLRPPLERMVSHSYELARWGMVRPPKQGFCSNYSHMRRLAPAVYDNYYLRVLLGERVLGLPPGGITSAHITEAKRVLSSLQLVLLSNDAATPVTLQRATGIANFTACRDTTRPARCAMSDEDSERARRDNAHDLALYDYAERLAAQHVASWRGGEAPLPAVL